MRKHGYYQYIVFEDKPNEWVYEIYTLDEKPSLVVESDEWFDTQVQAGFAAIGHISLLENGEG
jgi:hypothetical protein